MSYHDNVNTLENLISEIKFLGFNNIKQEILEKDRIRQELEANIQALKKRKTFISQENKQMTSNNSKILYETHVYHNKNQRLKRDVYFFNKDIPNYDQDINEMKDGISFHKNENADLNREILNEQRDIEFIKDEIRKMNKSITNLKKDKESVRISINLLEKHNFLLLEKINGEDKKSKEFIGNISTFLNTTIKSQK